MGTVSVSELQKEIKEIIACLGWSQNRLAREIYVEIYDYDDEDEIRKFQEKLRKDLSRNSVKPELLKGYLKVLANHGDFKRIDVVVPIYLKSGALSDSLEIGMKQISKVVNEISAEKDDA